jgi:prevent-host-death family protein
MFGKEIPLSEIKDDLSRYLREAETQEIVSTRHGKPAGVLIGFESEEDWFADAEGAGFVSGFRRL